MLYFVSFYERGVGTKAIGNTAVFDSFYKRRFMSSFYLSSITYILKVIGDVIKPSLKICSSVVKWSLRL